MAKHADVTYLDTGKVIPLTDASSHIYDAQSEKDSNAIGQKLLEMRKSRDLSMEEVCTLLRKRGVSVQRGAVSKWELGTTVPNSYQLMALCDTFDIDDALSYFRGKPALNEVGRAKVASYRADLIASGNYEPEYEECEVVYIDMPCVLQPASAGPGNFLTEGNYETISVQESSVPKGAEFGIRVSGDSMEPVFVNGQLVWVQECSELRRGEIGIFMLDGESYIKKYSEKKPENPEEFMDSSGAVRPQPVLISLNKKYKPIVVQPYNRFQIVGRVL